MQIHRSKLMITSSLVAMDVLLIITSLYLAYYTRFFSFITGFFSVTKGIPDWKFYSQTLYLIIPLWIFLFYKFDFYKKYFLPLMDELIRITQAVSLGIFFLVMVTFFYGGFSYSRLTFLLLWLLTIILLLVFRESFKFAFRYLFQSSSVRENILVVGKENKMLKSILKRHPHISVSYFPYEDKADIERIKEIVTQNDIRQITLTHMKWSENKLLSFYDWCENKNIDLKFVPDIVQLCRGEVVIDSSLGIPIFHIKPISLTGINFYLKRITDLILSIILLSFLWPVFLLLGILIKIDSPGSFFYFHKRMGYQGKTFDFFKFRTMVTQADVLLEKFKAQSERKGPVFKMANDPRVTRIGRFLRRYSIDEIPQLINVLRGDMSMVGPRPQVLWEAAAYNDWSKRRLRVLPGITGLWQVSGRASLSYEEMIELDIYYIENWSLGLDLKILMQTVPAVFSKKGAY